MLHRSPRPRGSFGYSPRAAASAYASSLHRGSDSPLPASSDASFPAASTLGSTVSGGIGGNNGTAPLLPPSAALRLTSSAIVTSQRYAQVLPVIDDPPNLADTSPLPPSSAAAGGGGGSSGNVFVSIYRDNDHPRERISKTILLGTVALLLPLCIIAAALQLAGIGTAQSCGDDKDPSQMCPALMMSALVPTAVLLFVNVPVFLYCRAKQVVPAALMDLVFTTMQCGAGLVAIADPSTNAHPLFFFIALGVVLHGTPRWPLHFLNVSTWFWIVVANDVALLQSSDAKTRKLPAVIDAGVLPSSGMAYGSNGVVHLVSLFVLAGIALVMRMLDDLVTEASATNSTTVAVAMKIADGDTAGASQLLRDAWDAKHAAAAEDAASAARGGPQTPLANGLAAIGSKPAYGTAGNPIVSDSGRTSADRHAKERAACVNEAVLVALVRAAQTVAQVQPHAPHWLHSSILAAGFDRRRKNGEEEPEVEMEEFPGEGTEDMRSVSYKHRSVGRFGHARRSSGAPSAGSFGRLRVSSFVGDPSASDSGAHDRLTPPVSRAMSMASSLDEAAHDHGVDHDGGNGGSGTYSAAAMLDADSCRRGSVRSHGSGRTAPAGAPRSVNGGGSTVTTRPATMIPSALSDMSVRRVSIASVDFTVTRPPGVDLQEAFVLYAAVVRQAFTAADALGGAIHSFVGDTIVASWNSVVPCDRGAFEALRFAWRLRNNPGHAANAAAAAVTTVDARCQLIGHPHASAFTVSPVDGHDVVRQLTALARQSKAVLIDGATRESPEILSSFILRGVDVVLSTPPMLPVSLRTPAVPFQAQDYFLPGGTEHMSPLAYMAASQTEQSPQSNTASPTPHLLPLQATANAAAFGHSPHTAALLGAFHRSNSTMLQQQAMVGGPALPAPNGVQSNSGGGRLVSVYEAVRWRDKMMRSTESKHWLALASANDVVTCALENCMAGQYVSAVTMLDHVPLDVRRAPLVQRLAAAARQAHAAEVPPGKFAHRADYTMSGSGMGSTASPVGAKPGPATNPVRGSPAPSASSSLYPASAGAAVVPLPASSSGGEGPSGRSRVRTMAAAQHSDLLAYVPGASIGAMPNTAAGTLSAASNKDMSWMDDCGFDISNAVDGANNNDGAQQLGVHTPTPRSLSVASASRCVAAPSGSHPNQQQQQQHLDGTPRDGNALPSSSRSAASVGAEEFNPPPPTRSGRVLL